VEAPSPTASSRPEAPSTEAGALPIEQLRQAVEDLFEPRPRWYWLDLIASATCFYGGLAVVATTSIPGPLKLAAAVVAVLGLYRAVIFIHELAHFPPGRMPSFRFAWNLVCGVPLLAPDFLYRSHVDHHRRRAYGTANDGEYLPWGSPGHRLAIVTFLLSSFVALPAAVLRFGLLGPLSWLNPTLREWVAVSASSLVVDMRYRRTLPSLTEARRWRRQEAAVFIYLCAVAIGLLTSVISVGMLAQLYVIASAALFLNGLRTLAAHRYGASGMPLTATQQLLDSINYPRRPFLTELWAPVGLRFHAAHHLFPGIPYHNLPAAHARIMRCLPPNSSYHQTEGRGLMISLARLWRAAGVERRLVVPGAPLRSGDAGG
jgi:fatty acid desaturase